MQVSWVICHRLLVTGCDYSQLLLIEKTVLVNMVICKVKTVLDMILFSLNLQQTSLMFYFPFWTAGIQNVFQTKLNSPAMAKPDYNDNDDNKSGQH